MQGIFSLVRVCVLIKQLILLALKIYSHLIIGEISLLHKEYKKKLAN